mmetsp:Transcript_71808/g.199281  ORF Transcript_71808/g.199281 Transcript_71808/m.199281 type:complete len:624 (-) Transcript_71808:249-2120(-)
MGLKRKVVWGKKGRSDEAKAGASKSDDKGGDNRQEQRGVKRKAAALGEVAKGKGEKKKKAKTEEKGKKLGKGEKVLSLKKKKRREVTTLYSELINPGKERASDKIVGEILALLDKRSTSLQQYCSSEIGSRIVQACLKWGDREQRRRMLTLLKKDLPKMATDRYGHVVVQKLLTYIVKTSTDRVPSAEEKKAQAQNLREFLEVFRGKTLRRAFFHKFGCRVINSIYFSDLVNSREKRLLLQEVAVPPTVALQRTELPGSRTLRQLLAGDSDLSQEHQTAVLTHLTDMVEKAVDKELLGVDIVHLLFQAYCEKATEAQLRDLAEKCMAGAPYLLSSKPGSEALLYLLGVASAKQRKAFCKDLKGKFVALATNAVDYLVMMRLIMTVDDTVLTVKSVLSEWMGELEKLVFDKYGHKVLVWVFRPDDPKYFDPNERRCMALPAPSSLKAADTRRQELARTLRPAIRTALEAGPLKAADDVYAKQLLAAFLSSEWDAGLIEAILNAGEKEASNPEFGLLGNGTSVSTLLMLLKLEPESPPADARFAEPLWRRCFLPRLVTAATSRCAFVILEMLKREGPTSESVRAALRKQRKEVEAAVKAAEVAGSVVSGARKLLTALDEKAASKA